MKELADSSAINTLEETTIKGRVLSASSNKYTVDLGQETVVINARKKIKYRSGEILTGDFVEVVDDVQHLVGHKTINLFYGTSTYTVDEMRTLLDWLVDQAEQMEIPLKLSKAQEEEMLERWGMK